MQKATLRPYVSADAPWIVEAHRHLYEKDEGFDDTFGPLVADVLTEFDAAHDAACERGWIATQGPERLGTIFCVKAPKAGWAKLRLFLLTPAARGQGLGRLMLGTCMGYAKARGYRGMMLWTHESHRAACALYEKTGWTLERAKPVHSFGQDLVEQHWSITF